MNNLVFKFISFRFWIIDLCEIRNTVDRLCMIFIKVRRCISVLTLSQQWESLSLASEVIKTFFVDVVHCGLDL